jgi:hypothetical protein
MPCPFIQISFGNILTEEFETIRERAFDYRYFREYAPNCLAAEDRDFVGNARCYAQEVSGDQLPLPHTEAFFDRVSALG